MPKTTVYRFHVGDAVPLEEAEQTLHLSMIAVEGLFSPAAVRLDARYHLDRVNRAILVDGSTRVGDSLARVFATLLAREFGDECFAVRRATRSQDESGEMTSLGCPAATVAR